MLLNTFVLSTLLQCWLVYGATTSVKPSGPTVKLDKATVVGTTTGTVESYCVDERGNKLEATEEHWLETYLCSVLRAYSYADTGSGEAVKRIIGVRRFNPITTTDQEHRFLDAAEKLFFSG